MSAQAIAAIENGRRLRPHRQTVEALVGALRLAGEQGEAMLAAARAAREAPLPISSSRLSSPLSVT
jgi:hypothetical protein